MQTLDRREFTVAAALAALSGVTITISDPEEKFASRTESAQWSQVIPLIAYVAVAMVTTPVLDLVPPRGTRSSSH